MSALLQPRTEADRDCEIAGELFSLMATPMRLKIISSLCQGAKSVSDLLAEIATTPRPMCRNT